MRLITFTLLFFLTACGGKSSSSDENITTDTLIFLSTSNNDQLVSKNKNASEKEIRDGLEGNICRCTGYHNIVKSVKAGAEKMGV